MRGSKPQVLTTTLRSLFTLCGNRIHGCSLEANNVTTTPISFFKKWGLVTAGFEPAKLYATVLKTVPFDLSGKLLGLNYAYDEI